MSLSIGIDTGGTFVDLAVMDEQGNISIFKTPTTPREYLAGIVKGHRPIYFQAKRGFVSTSIYDGNKLKAGNEIVGPAIIEYPTTTLVIPPEQSAKWEEWLNAIIS